MRYLPLFFKLTEQQVLLVGGGEVALRKARVLQKSGATIHVVALHICTELRELLTESRHRLAERDFCDDDIVGRQLVVAATDDTVLNSRISTQCFAQGIPVNVVDQPELCSVIFPAIIDRDPITIAISSGGSSPVLTRILRASLESSIASGYGRLALLAAQFRQRVKQVVPNASQRRRFWEDVLQGPVAEMALAGRQDDARAALESLLEAPAKSPTGEVYLVGAGPGDPDLLTFKALRLMQKADIVLYDRLVAPEIVDLCRADAERVYVGKKRKQHSVPQQDINELLLQHALQGKRVLRLKGGDPFIFGRGGEEIERLAQHGIHFQVVPGITAASGCACYSGIPLTHRDHAQSVRFVTGHLQEGSAELPWKELVHPQQTVVFYMGLAGLPHICQSLIQHGRASDTPIALIEQGTTAKHRVIVGDLANIVERVAERDVHAPTLLIVGEVVKLHETLQWYGQGLE